MCRRLLIYVRKNDKELKTDTTYRYKVGDLHRLKTITGRKYYKIMVQKVLISAGK